MRRFLASHLPEIWQDKTHPVSKLLFPLSLIYQMVISVRRKAYQLGFFKSESVGVPVIIVGNISVGGTGKTPIVVWLSGYLQSQGLKVGIISRGYGGSSPHWPVDVTLLDKADIVGDEAILLKQKTGVPVFVSPIRLEAARGLLEKHRVDVIISDDGLQHLALKRDFELIVIDAKRKFGNQRLLPSGPLREPISAISPNALPVYSGNDGIENFEYSFQFQPVKFRNVNSPEMSLEVDELFGKSVHAVAGIGDPDKFFNTLNKLNINIQKHAFPDHYVYQRQDLLFENNLPIVMTEKDAVKCKELNLQNSWYLEINAQPNKNVKNSINEFIRTIQ